MRGVAEEFTLFLGNYVQCTTPDGDDMEMFRRFSRCGDHVRLRVAKRKDQAVVCAENITLVGNEQGTLSVSLGEPVHDHGVTT